LGADGGAGLLPNLPGGAGRGCDGAEPVVVGGLDRALLSCTAPQLYPISNPTRVPRAVRAPVIHGQNVPAVLDRWTPKRRDRSLPNGSG
jgi:hypothetical protein